jgi:hypothetical protein
MQIEVNKIHENILQSLLDYSKYLYEEENERRDRLNNAVKVYIGFLTFILAIGVFRLIPFEELILLLKNRTYIVISIFGVIFYGTSVISFFISFIFTILVLKMWPFERLSDPRTMVVKSIFMENKNDYVSSMISDYVVACNANHEINNQKSRLLSWGLTFLIGGFILFVLSVFIIKALGLLQGGIK